ncbi:hypothetical protein LzC2_42560 [Planctomycetes bacterium LzC2]|uniref:Uncharacterized protein n=1 Tax=Alienimonas chondri TaxID=2681879 RepID=A0ABX1VLF7_9PLAN|nr:hypothetical protein [Alienimonas chondri]
MEPVDGRRGERRRPVAVCLLEGAAGGPGHALLVPVRDDGLAAVHLGEGDVAGLGGAGVGEQIERQHEIRRGAVPGNAETGAPTVRGDRREERSAVGAGVDADGRAFVAALQGEVFS